MTQEGIVKVLSVQERDGVSYGGGFSSYRNKWAKVQNSQELKRLLINGTLNGQRVYFWTPNVIINVAEGYLNYRHLGSNNGWYKEIKGKLEGVKNDFYFDDGKGNRSIGEVPVCISSKSEIVPAIEVGDEIRISYKVKKVAATNGALQLNYVKLLK